MLRDALEFIFKTAHDSVDPKPHFRKLGPLTRVVTLAGKETVEGIEAPRIDRVAEDLGSIAVLIDEFGGVKPTVFISEGGIQVVLDDDDRLEKVTMQFEQSDQFLVLRSLAAGVSQPTLVRTLRTKLAGCVGNENTLAIIRQMEFDVNRGARGNVQHTKESLGRSIEKEVRTKAGELPETLRVVVPLFSVPHDVPTDITLECAVSIDIENEKIALEPTGDSLIREKKRIMSVIAARLAESVPEGTVVVFGSASCRKVAE